MTADSHSPAPPIAIRITRPYASEEEYLEHELDTLTRASITLVGAQPRAEGVVLRFEVVLTTGQVLIRGEGRVVGFKPSTYLGPGGLSLRFTRLDMRSKALVDKAAALRERRRPSLRPAGAEPAPVAMPAHAVAPQLPPEAPPPLPVTPQPIPVVAPPFIPVVTLPSIVDPPTPLADAESPVVVARTSPAVPPPIARSSSPDRDALLDRLRARARALDPETVREILGQHRRTDADNS